jgi:molybdenum cofactor cytidylyltransferase
MFAIIPAAGQSKRMGVPKLALPFAGRTVLQVVIAALRGGGADPVLVVVGLHVPDLAELAEAVGARVYRLPAPTADMRATVEQGLDWLQERYAPQPDDGWLLAPADHPVLDADVVRRLGASREARPERSLFVPVCGDKRGHPTLFTWRHVAGIRSLPPGQGINAYLRLHAEEIVEVPIERNGVLLDMDTPEDYERLRGLTP